MNLFRKKQAPMKKNQAKQLKPGQRYNVIYVIDRTIKHKGSFETFDDALFTVFDILSDNLPNTEATELEQGFNHKAKSFEFTLNGLAFTYDRSKNTIEAWSNVKNSLDIKVLVF